MEVTTGTRDECGQQARPAPVGSAWFQILVKPHREGWSWANSDSKTTVPSATLCTNCRCGHTHVLSYSSFTCSAWASVVARNLGAFVPQFPQASLLVTCLPMILLTLSRAIHTDSAGATSLLWSFFSACETLKCFIDPRAVERDDRVGGAIPLPCSISVFIKDLGRQNSEKQLDQNSETYCNVLQLEVR